MSKNKIPDQVCICAWLLCRERSDGLYKSVTYLVAKLLEEVIVALVQSLIMSCIVFFPLALAGSWSLFWYTYFQTTVIGIRTSLFPPLTFTATQQEYLFASLSMQKLTLGLLNLLAG